MNRVAAAVVVCLAMWVSLAFGQTAQTRNAGTRNEDTRNNDTKNGQRVTLSLTEALGRALRSHPILDLAAANVQRAQSMERDAKGSRFPSVSIDGNVTRFQEPMVVAPLHGLDLRNPPEFDRTLTQGALSATYLLFDAGRGSRIERARLMSGVAESGVPSATQQVISDVVRAYARTAASRDVRAANDRRVEALGHERDRAAQLVELGKAARVVLLRAEAGLSAARAEAVAAAGDVEVAENQLAREVGMPVDSIRGMSVAIREIATPLPSLLEARAQTRENNPDLIRARRQVAAVHVGLAEARALKLPRLQLGGRYVEYGSTETSPQGEWQSALQLSYPLFTGGTRGAASDRAAAEERAAKAEYDVAERRIEDALDRAFSALATAHARVTALQSAVTQSEEVTRIDRLALDAGAGVQTDYLAAEADLLRARAGWAEARTLELLARIEIARLTGMLSLPWIEQNVESHQ